MLDLAEYRLDFVDGRPAAEHDDASASLIEAVLPADAVILASPIYRASYTGALKNALDWFPIEAMRDELVGIVAMETTAYHYLAVDGPPTRGAGLVRRVNSVRNDDPAQQLDVG